MKVLTIGSERRLFEEGSRARERIASFGALVEELHIIVFTKGGALKATKIADNVFVYPTNSFSRWFYMRDAKRIGKEILGKEKAQWIISAQDPFEAGLVGRALSRAFHVPLELQVHTDFLSPYFRRTILNRLRVMIAGRTLPHADSLRVVSERVRTSLVSRYHLKAMPEILPVFTDTSIVGGTPDVSLKEKFKGFTFTILTVARLAGEKHIGLALEALKSVIARYPETALVVVGDGPERESLEKLAKLLGVANNVFFEGHQENIAGYYKMADVFLATSDFEGYGLTLIEAALAGCPIVTTDVGIVGEMFKDTVHALVCPVGYADCISAKLLFLIQNNNERERFSVTAREEALKTLMSKEAYMQRLKTLWELCLAKGELHH